MKDLFNDIPLSSENEMPEWNMSNGYDPYLSSGEYEELRLLLTSARAAFPEEEVDIMPDPQIKKNLRALVAARRKGFEWPAFNFQKLLSFPVPAYQVGIAMVLVLLVTIFMGKRAESGANTAGIVYKTDTIYEKVYKKSSNIVASNDSQAKMTRPASFSADYTDSIDTDFGTDSNQNYNNSNVNHQDNSQSPGAVHEGYRHDPAFKELNRQRDMDTPEKGGGDYPEDTSKWSKPLHGLM